MTLDGDGSGNNDGTGRVYTGSEAISAALADTINNVYDNSHTDGDRFKVGASLSAWGVHNMPAQFADVRFYDELLDLSAIEGIRLEALTSSTVPEPSTLVILGGLALLVYR